MIDEKKLIEDSGKLKVRYFDDDKRPYVTLYDFCNLIIDQPKISEWISCSERLPEWGTRSYLVCLKNGGIFLALFLSNGKFAEISSMGTRDFCQNNPVIAWRPLPEPYQEKVKKDMRSSPGFTEEEQALIDGVEFGIDYQLEVAPEDIEEYHRLISSRCYKTGQKKEQEVKRWKKIT